MNTIGNSCDFPMVPGSKGGKEQLIAFRRIRTFF